MKKLVQYSKRFAQWLVIAIVAASMFAGIQGSPVEANTLEVTNIYAEKERLHEASGFVYTYGETIELMIEFNQPVSCSTGGFEMQSRVGQNYVYFEYDRMKDSRTAIFTYTVDIYVSGQLTFRAYHDGIGGGSPTKIPCSNYEVPHDQVSSKLDSFISGWTRYIDIDVDPPVLIAVGTRQTSGNYKQGDEIELWLTFNENVNRHDGIYLLLNNGKKVLYGSTGFRYYIQPDDHIEQLDVVEVVGTISDWAGFEWDP